MLTIRTQPSLHRDFTLLSLFILFILALLCAWVTIETIGTYEKDLQKKLETQALRLDRALILEIENASYLLESLGRQIQATGTENQNAISQLFFSFAKTEGPKRSIFSWTNADQMLLVSSNLGILKEPIDVSDRDYIKKSIAEPWKVHIGRPIDGRLSQKWVLPLSLGLTDSHGTYIGSAVISLDAEKLADNFTQTLKEAGVHFAITNRSLTLLTESTKPEDFFHKSFPSHDLEAIDFNTFSSGLYTNGALWNSEATFGYYEQSNQYPYTIFLAIDKTNIHSVIWDMVAPRIFQLCVVSLFLLFVLYIVRRRIIHPVIHLTEQTAAIVRGGSFDASATQGPLEIQTLSHEIQRVSLFIQERQRVESELRLKNIDLNRMKDAAQLTNQVKAEFFSFVGQELTEPTEMILEQIETLKDEQFGPLGNPIYAQHAKDIHNQAQLLLAMLAEIKTISEAETGLIALNDTEINLPFLIQKTVRIFREKSQTPMDVQLDLPSPMPLIRGDDLRIKQLILNILQAASRQLSAGDLIRITGSIKTHEILISFVYASNSTTDMSRPKSIGQFPLRSQPRSRHGLELALARLLISLHQGTLEMKTTQDRTSTITIKFPALRII